MKRIESLFSQNLPRQDLAQEVKPGEPTLLGLPVELRGKIVHAAATPNSAGAKALAALLLLNKPMMRWLQAPAQAPLIQQHCAWRLQEKFQIVLPLAGLSSAHETLAALTNITSITRQSAQARPILQVIWEARSGTSGLNSNERPRQCAVIDRPIKQWTSPGPPDWSIVSWTRTGKIATKAGLKCELVCHSGSVATSLGAELPLSFYNAAVLGRFAISIATQPKLYFHDTQSQQEDGSVTGLVIDHRPPCSAPPFWQAIASEELLPCDVAEDHTLRLAVPLSLEIQGRQLILIAHLATGNWIGRIDLPMPQNKKNAQAWRASFRRIMGWPWAKRPSQQVAR